MDTYDIEDYSKEREYIKKEYPDAYWWFDDQSILPQNKEELKHLDYFENESFYVFNNVILAVEKKLKEKYGIFISK